MATRPPNGFESQPVDWAFFIIALLLQFLHLYCISCFAFRYTRYRNPIQLTGLIAIAASFPFFLANWILAYVYTFEQECEFQANLLTYLLAQAFWLPGSIIHYTLKARLLNLVANSWTPLQIFCMCYAVVGPASFLPLIFFTTACDSPIPVWLFFYSAAMMSIGNILPTACFVGPLVSHWATVAPESAKRNRFTFFLSAVGGRMAPLSLRSKTTSKSGNNTANSNSGGTGIVKSVDGAQLSNGISLSMVGEVGDTDMMTAVDDGCSKGSPSKLDTAIPLSPLSPIKNSSGGGGREETDSRATTPHVLWTPPYTPLAQHAPPLPSNPSSPYTQNTKSPSPFSPTSPYSKVPMPYPYSPSKTSSPYSAQGSHTAQHPSSVNPSTSASASASASASGPTSTLTTPDTTLSRRQALIIRRAVLATLTSTFVTFISLALASSEEFHWIWGSVGIRAELPVSCACAVMSLPLPMERTDRRRGKMWLNKIMI